MAGIEALLEIMARLRDPEGGCPWDLEQNFSTISPHTIEEAYEVDEAIVAGDPEMLRDELGDLLFQVVFQARIAEESGAFDFEGVIQAITEKLVRRHPHVFGSAETPETLEAQTANWERIKAAERLAAGPPEAGVPDPFAGIPRHLPALARSAKVEGRLARLALRADGADGQTRAALDPAEIAAALAGAHAQVEAVLAGSGSDAGQRDQRMRLIGAGLNAWVRLARACGIDPEQALRRLDDETIEAVRRDVHQAGKSARR
ncbi:MAG: nucleoside triphosphate pyrophosphohydrolase [Deltaproteobacteria bacterium]|nr:nucleoside triphosphate pyrophosphohydrolase [Deltaproteobacteria bacterium]